MQWTSFITVVGILLVVPEMASLQAQTGDRTDIAGKRNVMRYLIDNWTSAVWERIESKDRVASDLQLALFDGFTDKVIELKEFGGDQDRASITMTEEETFLVEILMRELKNIEPKVTESAIGRRMARLKMDLATRTAGPDYEEAISKLQKRFDAAYATKATPERLRAEAYKSRAYDFFSFLADELMHEKKSTYRDSGMQQASGNVHRVWKDFASLGIYNYGPARVPDELMNGMSKLQKACYELYYSELHESPVFKNLTFPDDNPDRTGLWRDYLEYRKNRQSQKGKTLHDQATDSLFSGLTIMPREDLEAANGQNRQSDRNVLKTSAFVCGSIFLLGLCGWIVSVFVQKHLQARNDN